MPFGSGKPLEAFDGRAWIVEGSCLDDPNVLENVKGLTVSRSDAKGPANVLPHAKRSISGLPRLLMATRLIVSIARRALDLHHISSFEADPRRLLALLVKLPFGSGGMLSFNDSCLLRGCCSRQYLLVHFVEHQH